MILAEFSEAASNTAIRLLDLLPEGFHFAAGAIFTGLLLYFFIRLWKSSYDKMLDMSYKEKERLLNAIDERDKRLNEFHKLLPNQAQLPNIIKKD
ncbi:hypothetical protein [Cerasicoccus maritimus]|uniref:hypothetical protein n=1 Tax=Cerasicoccus maritimus TaxID=490089 RepID=UPI0028526B5E|nr:hypothetical protein [Cerasicoccus maritimus]